VRALVLFSAAPLAACSTTSSSPQAASTPPAEQSPVDVTLATAIDAAIADSLDFNGSVLVALDGEVALSGGYGQADHSHGVPNTPNTRFRIGSVTKQFTAMGIVILQSRGQLSVDDRMCAYIQGCPKAWEPVTVEQLLSHTSGLPDFTELPGFDPRVAATPKQTLAEVRGMPLEVEPGGIFSYSNTNYIALGLIVEKVASMPYARFLQQNIFNPLAMDDTGYDTGKDQLAVGYKSGFHAADDIDMSVPYAAGGLYSTTGDLKKWDDALYTEQLAPKDAIATMFTPVAETTDYLGYTYGYGVYLESEGDGSRGHQFHSGGIDGFTAHVGRYPDERLCVVLLTNRESTDDLLRLDYTIANIVRSA
jgi:CubicO group peptidase (beta-lactamase class C family)